MISRINVTYEWMCFCWYIYHITLSPYTWLSSRLATGNKQRSLLLCLVAVFTIIFPSLGFFLLYKESYVQTKIVYLCHSKILHSTIVIYINGKVLYGESYGESLLLCTTHFMLSWRKVCLNLMALVLP